MTDITDQDRRAAMAWAKNWQGDQDGDTSAAARVILATVEAPARTIPEELQYRADLLDNGDPDGDTPQALRDLAARAAQMERDLTEARAEVDHLKRDLTEAYETRDARDYEVDRLRADVARLPAAQKGAESNAESLDPADVKPGEAWLVEYDGEKRNGVKDKEDPIPWNTVTDGGWLSPLRNTEIKLVSRLVPAPRVITNADDLERLPHNSVILSADNDAWQKSSETSLWASAWWFATWNSAEQTPYIEFPVTVLWEPEA